MPESTLRQTAQATPEKPPLRTWVRVTRYVVARGFMLLLLLTLGMYIAVIVANLGGFIDEIYEERIDNILAYASMGMEGTLEEKQIAIDQMRAVLEEAYGLNEPFLWRCLRWLYRSLTLDMVTPRVWEALPYTLLIVVTSYLFLFFSATALSLYLSRRYGRWIDRVVSALSPLSAAPSWVHGIILVTIFAAELGILPFGGLYDDYPPTTQIGYIWVIFKHMLLPVLAIVLSVFFQCVYAWRTFFLIQSTEDYVELARAKGLPDRMLERRYVLRPALPYFITSFALLLVGVWQESIALEYFFSWPGLGRLYLTAVRSRWYNPSDVMGTMVLFAYLLAVTVFVLDITYAIVDPRIRIVGTEMSRRASKKRLGRRGQPARKKTGPGLRHVGRSARQKKALRLRHTLAPTHPVSPRARSPGVLQGLGQGLRRAGSTLREILRFPSAVFGLVVILALVGVSIYTVIALPRDEVVALWESGSWRLNPRDARPVWTNWFRREPLPETVILDSREGEVSKESKVLTPEMTVITISLAFDYSSRMFPQDILLDLKAQYREKLPLTYMIWKTPDGREIPLGSMQLVSAQTYILSQDDTLRRKLKNDNLTQALFAAPETDPVQALPGRYELELRSFVFEEGSDVDALFALHGRVFGLAGTDHERRDLVVALLWGTPMALGLGLLGAVGSTLIAITVAAIGVWFGGWVDRIIQWVSELNMLLPALPLAVMVYFFYTKSIWPILAVLIVVSSFGRALKNLRAALLQVRELPYVECAQAYGAGNARIIMRYLVPRVIPVLVPQLVIMIPGFVFLEATLAILGVREIYLPTWGKIIHDALTSGVVYDHYYRVLEPVVLLVLTGLAFAMLGYSLDRIFNPRLRSMHEGLR